MTSSANRSALLSVSQYRLKLALLTAFAAFVLVIIYQKIINNSHSIHVGMFNAQNLEATRVRSLGNNQTFNGTNGQRDTFPKILTDAVGENYILEKPPMRIASVTLATDEMLAQLIDPQRIVGVTYFADDPAVSNVIGQYPATLPRLKGDVETILSLQPDLVFIAAYTQANTVRTLLGAGIPVARLARYRSFDDLEHNLRLVAELTGTKRKADVIIRDNKKRAQRIASLVANLPKPRVLYYDLSGYTAGRGSLMDETIALAGGSNAVHDIELEGSGKISAELAISLEPDVILLAGMPKSLGQTPSEILAQRAGWLHSDAVKNQRVYAVEGPWVLSVSQYRWDGIEVVARLIHPEVFNQ